jgi:hypothetical protein
MRATSGVEDPTAARVPTFSVIIPSYNNPDTIGSAIRSVLRQTVSDFELIVVDDASTDATPQVIEGFLVDERVTLVTRDVNGGQSAARNTGIARARGTFVCLLDSDDLWLPAYLEMMGKTLAATPRAAVAYTDAWVLYDGIRRILRRTAMEAYRPPVTPVDPAAFLLALLEYGNFVYYSITARRDALQEVGGYDEALRGAPDYELWLRLCAAGHAFVPCSETLGIYRRRQGQLTADADFKAQASAKIFQVVLEEHDLSDEARRLASRRAQEYERAATRGPGRRRRLPIVSGPDGALARLRWFYRRPPASVRDAFPNLNEI